MRCSYHLKSRLVSNLKVFVKKCSTPLFWINLLIIINRIMNLFDVQTRIWSMRLRAQASPVERIRHYKKTNRNLNKRCSNVCFSLSDYNTEQSHTHTPSLHFYTQPAAVTRKFFEQKTWTGYPGCTPRETSHWVKSKCLCKANALWWTSSF